VPQNNVDYKAYDFNSSSKTIKNESLNEVQECLIYKDKKREKSLIEDAKWLVYPDSGIYIYRSSRVYLIISGTPNGQKGLGGHGHNDKLSIELDVDGIDIIVDPGTYLYSPLPEYRNRFRSVKSHSAVVIDGEEQNLWEDGPDGLFAMNDETKVRLLDLKDTKISLMAQYRDKTHVRDIFINNSQVIVKDYCNFKFEFNLNQGLLYSNGYGKLINLKNVIKKDLYK